MRATALLLIDLQNDYFPGGAFPLPHAPEAGAAAARLLDHFRHRGGAVVHVQHENVRPGAPFFLPGTAGMRIQAGVAPVRDERVVLKHRPNAFLDTDLKAVLGALGVEKLVVSGMMTNMCVDATVRAAVDMGYPCVLAHDGCAAANLSFGSVDVPAAQVHAAFVAALGFAYAQALSCDEILRC